MKTLLIGPLLTEPSKLDSGNSKELLANQDAKQPVDCHLKTKQSVSRLLRGVNRLLRRTLLCTIEYRVKPRSERSQRPTNGKPSFASQSVKSIERAGDTLQNLRAPVVQGPVQGSGLSAVFIHFLQLYESGMRLRPCDHIHSTPAIRFTTLERVVSFDQVCILPDFSLEAFSLYLLLLRPHSYTHRRDSPFERDQKVVSGDRLKGGAHLARLIAERRTMQTMRGGAPREGL